MRWESEERGEEYAQRRGRVNGPAEPDAHVRDFGPRGLVPADEGVFRAGWRGEGDGRMGELESLSVSS
jgi:hypothetical protein